MLIIWQKKFPLNNRSCCHIRLNFINLISFFAIIRLKTLTPGHLNCGEESAIHYISAAVQCSTRHQ